MDAVMPYTIQANFNSLNNRELPFEWLCRVAGCTHHDVTATRSGAEHLAARHAATHTETELASTGYVVRVNYAALAAATEPATPRPAMKRINVTPKMVEALENTIEINGKRAMIMSHPKSQASLVPRGLADEHGYLTDQGRFVAHLISLGTTDRAWSWDTIEAGTRTWLSDQKRHAEAAKPKAVGDVMVPPADFRVAAPTLEDVELDSDAADREDARREAVTEYSVKIWYRSGAYEGAPHCPEDLARKIFADAVESAGVEFAELHGPSGKLVESKTRTEESPVTTEPEQPTENLFLAGLPLLHPEPLPPAPELLTEPEENTGG